VKRVSPTLIGAFVVGGVALTIAAIAIIGSGRWFARTYPFVLYFPGEVDGLHVGAPVRFKGVEIGNVTKIMLHYDQPPEDRHIPVFINLDANKVSSAGGWADLSPERIQAAVERGLRAQLQTESLLTGLLFVQLDFQPNTAAKFVGVAHETPEIPTLPTALEQIQLVVRRLLDKLEHFDLDRLGRSIESTVEAVEKLVNSPELKETIVALHNTMESIEVLSKQLSADMGPAVKSFLATSDRAQKTMVELEATLTSTRTLIAPDSPLAYQVVDTLENLSQAARSVRALADALERDPSMLLRGRNTERRQ